MKIKVEAKYWTDDRLEPVFSDVFHVVIENAPGIIMIGVIVASRKVGINPDNVATPIAASLGDLITLSLLAGISTGLYKELGMA